MLLGSPTAGVGQGAAPVPLGQQRRGGRSVHGTSGAHAHPLLWNTFTLEVSHLELQTGSTGRKDIFYLKAKPGTKPPPAKLFIASHAAARIQQG